MSNIENRQSLNKKVLQNHLNSHKERGVVAILVALSIAVLIGFVGLALDLGKLFVTKTELQSSADACALAAAAELTGVRNNQLDFAEAAGIATGIRNNVMFQNDAVSVEGNDVTFSDSLDGSYSSRGGVSEPLNMLFARCTVDRTGIPNWFMQILGIGDQDVVASAVATLAPSQEFSCALPVGICEDRIDKVNSPGKWLKGVVNSGDSVTGDFGWIRFGDTNSAAELDDIIEGSCGLVDIPAEGADIGKSGAVHSLAKAWNTRFGIYQTNPDKPQFKGDSGSPDTTGYAYYPGAVDTPDIFPLVSIPPDLDVAYNRFADYQQKASSYVPYQGNSALTDTVPLLNPNGGNNPLTDLQGFGVNGRRVSIVAVLEGSAPGCLDTPTLKEWACVFMLHPMNIGGNDRPMYLEYIGSASDENSPCATLGIPGGPDSTGPQVPTLVQ